jgi:integrase
VVDADGAEVAAVSRYLRDLALSDLSPLTCRSYGYDLLRWFRVLWALEVAWECATPSEADVMVGWMKSAPNPQRRRRKPGGTPPGAVNIRTGKPTLALGYAPRTINHALTVVFGFYAFHAHHGRGPVINPVPASRERRRALAHRSPIEATPVFRRGRLRQRVPAGPPRAIPDALWDELFEAMTCDRDRALLLFYVSSGARASELLGARIGDIDWAGMRVYVVSKGTRLREAVPPHLGETFTHQGHTYQRKNSRYDQKNHDDPIQPAVRVLNLDTGKSHSLVPEEETAFWEWTFVEILRHSGLRVEELIELTHLSLRQYQRPNGEVIALLVVAPSKTDRERVIPMSAELFHIIATIIRRHLAHGPIPLLLRYDAAERVWTAPMPYLFQRQIGSVRRVTSTATVLLTLRRRCEQIAQTDPAFCGLSFTPHDFRRLFATDLVNNGLPIHIGAALLGHLNLDTTRAAMSPSSMKMLSGITGTSSPVGAPCARARNTGRPARTRWPSSRNTSTSARWSSALAAAPMARPASMSMPASAARCCTSTPRCCPGCASWRPTCCSESNGLLTRVGWGRSKASISL